MIQGAALAAPASGLLCPRVTSRSHPKVKGPDLLAFFQQLSTLFRAGTPIFEALNIASGQSQSERLAAVIRDVAARVASGSALHAALAMHPRLFQNEWIQVIRSGEESGQLAEVLIRLTGQIDAASQLRGKLIGAMIYPVIVLCVAAGAITVLLVKVVPTFAGMFLQFGKELPGITQFVLDCSAFLREHGAAILGGVVACAFLLRRWARSDTGRERWHLLLVSVPFLGDVLVQSYMQKFALNLALLLRSGLPMLDAIRVVGDIFDGNVVYARAVHRVARHVERGGTLADGLGASGYFTSFVVSMARIGEGSGTLPDVLDEVEVFYRRKVENVVSNLTGTLETFVILGMGVTVAVILCAVYLPMFSMASGVG